MRRLVFLAPVALGVLLSGAALAAFAQFPASPYGQYFNPYSHPPGTNPGGGPRLSPYLNLLRGGNPAANYYLGVVPEIDRRRYQAISQSQIQALEVTTAVPPVNPEDTDLTVATSITGHPTVFNSTASYFGGAGAAPTPNRSVPMSPLPAPSPSKPAPGARTPTAPK
jgi:hypothetical protein